MDKRTENIVRYINNYLETAYEEGKLVNGSDVISHDALSFVVHMVVRNALQVTDIYDLLSLLSSEIFEKSYAIITEAYEFANEEERKLEQVAKEVNELNKNT